MNIGNVTELEKANIISKCIYFMLCSRDDEFNDVASRIIKILETNPPIKLICKYKDDIELLMGFFKRLSEYYDIDLDAPRSDIEKNIHAYEEAMSCYSGMGKIYKLILDTNN